MKLKKQNNKVAIIMGSQSDYSVMKDSEKILRILKIKYQVSIVSAHRTPKRMFEFAKNAEKITREATNRGSAFHDILEKYLLGKLNLDLLGDNTLERQMADQVIENGLKNQVSEIWGVEACLFYPKKYAGASDLIAIYNGKPSIIDFKNSTQLRKDEWNFEYYLQLSAYQMAHNKVYGTDINQGVILVCTKDLMFQSFVIDSERLKNYQEIFLRKVDEYYKMQLNNN